MDMASPLIVVLFSGMKSIVLRCCFDTGVTNEHVVMRYANICFTLSSFCWIGGHTSPFSVLMCSRKKRTLDKFPVFTSLRYAMDVNVIQKLSVHFTTNKGRLRYQDRQIRVIERKGHCTFWESHEFGDGVGSYGMLNRAKCTGCVWIVFFFLIFGGFHWGQYWLFHTGEPLIPDAFFTTYSASKKCLRM